MKEPRHLPGAGLLSAIALLSAALIVTNDLWLKRYHPGLLSGKLSDVGLCVFFPLFTVAALEWGAVALATLRLVPARIGTRPLYSVHVIGVIIAAGYFILIKTWPLATEAHVAALSALVPHWRPRAVTDPWDLLCLPMIGLAWWQLTRQRRGFAEEAARRSRALDPPSRGSIERALASEG